MSSVDGVSDEGVDLLREPLHQTCQRPVGGEERLPSEGDLGIDGLGQVIVEVDRAHGRRIEVTVPLSRALILKGEGKNRERQ